jgi:hypothetical protein
MRTEAKLRSDDFADCTARRLHPKTGLEFCKQFFEGPWRDEPKILAEGCSCGGVEKTAPGRGPRDGGGPTRPIGGAT